MSLLHTAQTAIDTESKSIMGVVSNALMGNWSLLEEQDNTRAMIAEQRAYLRLQGWFLSQLQRATAHATHYGLTMQKLTALNGQLRFQVIDLDCVGGDGVMITIDETGIKTRSSSIEPRQVQQIQQRHDLSYWH